LRRAKASLAVSKKGPTTWPGPDDLVKDAKLPSDLTEDRMRRKVERRIAPAQELYEKGHKKSAQGALDAFQGMEDPKEHFAGMRGRKVGTGPKIINISRADAAQPREGARVFRELLRLCQPPKEEPSIGIFRQQLEAAKRDQPNLVLLYENALQKALAKS